CTALCREVRHLSQKNRNELYKLSNQMIDLFVKDVFTKNKTDLEKAKSNISDDQRESLKESLHHLQTQVENFINDKNASKTITEDDAEKENETLSPLRKKLMEKSEVETNDNTEDNLQEENEE